MGKDTGAGKGHSTGPPLCLSMSLDWGWGLRHPFVISNLSFGIQYCMPSKSEFISLLTNPGIIAIVRAQKPEQVPPVSEALIAGGVMAIEITMTTPGALEAIRAARDQIGDRTSSAWARSWKRRPVTLRSRRAPNSS